MTDDVPKNDELTELEVRKLKAAIYRANNKEKITAYNKQWRIKNHERLLKEEAANRKKNRKKLNKYYRDYIRKKYYPKNREKCLQRAKEYREKNPLKVKAGLAAWRLKNPGYMAKYRKRKALQAKQKIEQQEQQLLEKNKLKKLEIAKQAQERREHIQREKNDRV